jgi:hypothetical protein
MRGHEATGSSQKDFLSVTRHLEVIIVTIENDFMTVYDCSTLDDR